MVKTDDIYKDIVEDFETRFDISNYELDRQLPKRRKKKNNWINERLIRWKNYQNNFCIKQKLIFTYLMTVVKKKK